MVVGVGEGGGALIPGLPGLGLPGDFLVDVPGLESLPDRLRCLSRLGLPCSFQMEVPDLGALPCLGVPCSFPVDAGWLFQDDRFSAFSFSRCLAFSSSSYRLIEASRGLICSCILLASFLRVR